MALRSRSRRRSARALSAPPIRGVERLWGRLVDLFGRREPLSATALVLAPRRLEPRRLLDAGAAGLALDLLDNGDFVQVGPDFASLADTSSEPQAVVPNTPPSNLVLQPITAVDEGSAALLELSFDDPDIGDVHTVEITWGDGSGLQTFTVAPGARTFSTTHTYADDPVGVLDPPFAVSVRVIDAENASVSGTTSATVRNVTPLVTAVDPIATIDENGNATLKFEFSDPGVPDSHQLVVNWGDGSPTQLLAIPAQARSFTATHKYLDDGATDQFLITFHVRDDDLGISGPDTAVAMVTNVAPTITTVKPVAAIDENQFATLELEFTDPGTLDAHEVLIDWGDGTPTQTLAVPAGARSFTTTHQYLDDNAADQFTITVRVRDDDGGVSAPQTATVTVRNVDPDITVIDPVAAIDENGEATLEFDFSDPGSLDSHQVIVNWGDGSPTQVLAVPAGARSFTAKHKYLDDNAADQYLITFHVRDDDLGISGPDTAVAVVRNVAPTITTVKPVAAIDENQFATLELEFTDPGTLDSHEVLVDWGDGTTQTLAVAAGARAFTTTHQYLDDNAADQYTITVRVRDDDGGVSASQTTVATVRNVDPDVTVIDPVAAIDENGDATLRFDFTDPGSVDTHQVIVNWGDGSPTQTLAVPAGARSFTATHKYLDDNAADQFTITFHVRDDDLGLSGPDTAVAVVRNVAPTITTVDPVAAIDENQFATLELDFSDPGTLDSHEVLIDWGDGTPTQTLAVPAGARTFTTTHQYLDDNAADHYTITVRVRDDDGGVSAPQTASVTVRNVDPDVTVIDPVAAIDENGDATLRFDFTDPGTLDSHQVIINWGDGSPTQTLAVPAGARSFTATHKYLDDNATDQFTITFHVRDDDMGLSGPDTAVAVVRNVAPTITNVDPVAMINENQFATLELDFADPGTLDTHEVIIDWGDGSPSQTLAVPAGARSFTTTHQYLDDNAADQYTITVRVRDDDGGVSAPQTALVTVKNVNPSNISITPPPGTINEGATHTYNFTFDDPGSLDTHTYVINWGDGFTSTGTAVGHGFTATHTYADNDSFTIRVTVTDDDGGVGIGVRTIAVANVPPTIVDIADDQTVAEGDELTLAEIARFTDPGFDNPMDLGSPSFERFTYSIDWGDTKSTPTTPTPDTNGAVGTPSSGAFGGSHTYADNGTYTVTVTVTDDDGGATSRTFTVVVTNIDPTLTGVNDPLEVDEGETFTLNDLLVGLEDPGFNNAANQNHPTNGGEFEETFTGMDVDWGDGTGLHPLVINPASIVNGDADTLTTARFEAGHTYADNGTYTVTLRFRDDDGPVVSRTFTIIVHNVAPTLNLTQDDFAIDEGGTLVINNLGSFNDPGFRNPNNSPANGGQPTDETFTYIITWADGTPPLTYTVSAADVATGSPGVLTQGMLLDLLANTHKYVDNDLDGTYDNSYTITVTLMDDDGGFDTKTFDVTVRNVSPTLLPISATDVNAQGKTTLTLSFSDPGADTFTIMVDWGDGVFVPEQGHPGPTPTTVVIEHFYAEPPDPNNPADDIRIRVQILDDDFGRGIIANGDSNVEDDVITNPGTGNRFIRIDTSPKVPMLAFPVRPVNATVIAAAQLAITSDDTSEIEGSAGEAAVAGERYLLLELIRPDGTVGDTARLRPEVLNNLPALFRNLPDGHYRIFLVQADTQVRRLVIEVFVRDGRLIDPSDDSEGARDRPPGADAPANPAAPADTIPPDAIDQAPADATAPSAQADPDANDAAWHAPGLAPTLSDEAWPTPTAMRHGSTLASVALALSAAGKAWRDQVDQSLAKAQSQKRKTLKTVGHWRGSRKPK